MDRPANFSAPAPAWGWAARRSIVESEDKLVVDQVRTPTAADSNFSYISRCRPVCRRLAWPPERSRSVPPTRLPPMAYDYRIIADENLLLITGSGEVSSKDIYRVVTAFQKDPAWNPTMNMLVDWRDVTELQIEEKDLAQLAEDALGPDHMALGTPLGPRAAVVLAGHEHARVPMKYYTYLRESGLKAKIFFGMDEAAKWLGVSPDLSDGDDESLA